jgi:2-iminobutanoate/2-iminopropanoate deaminase
LLFYSELTLEGSFATAGAELSDVVMATSYLKDITQQDIPDKLWEEEFGDHRPTTTSVQIERLAADPKLLIEITVAAVTD